MPRPSRRASTQAAAKRAAAAAAAGPVTKTSKKARLVGLLTCLAAAEEGRHVIDAISAARSSRVQARCS